MRSVSTPATVSTPTTVTTCIPSPPPTTTTPISPSPAPAADILLSLAKTDQYISHLSHLLIRVLSPYYACFTNRSSSSYTPTTETDIDAAVRTNTALRAIQPELMLLARLVHGWIVWCGGRTLGMQRLGLVYRQQQRRSDDGGGLLDYRRAVSFIVIYTIAPYLVERAGRGGWWDVISIHRDVGRRVGRRYGRIVRWLDGYNDNENDDDDDDDDDDRSERNGVTRNHESLHGEERRRVYEDMRRRMLQRASQPPPTPLRESSSLSHTVGGRGEGEPSTTTTTEQAPTPTRPSDHLTRFPSQSSSSLAAVEVICRRGMQFASRVLRCVDRAMDGLNPLPHARLASSSSSAAASTTTTLWNETGGAEVLLLDDGGRNEDDDRYRSLPPPPPPPGEEVGNYQRVLGELRLQQPHQQQPQTLRVDNIDFYSHIIRWVFRLNLALFYINGQYPTLLHRITGIRIGNGGNTDNVNNTKHPNNNHTVANRPSYDIIGKMILLQLLVKGIHTLSHYSIYKWISHRRRRRILRDEQRRRRRQTSSGRRSVQNQVHEQDDCNNNLQTRIEAMVPSHQGPSSSSTNNNNKHNDRVNNKQVVIDKDTTHRPMVVQCTICMNGRKDPAALTGCGHVFCWGCVQHWISTVRQECPVCRTVARPQDVIPLYHYSPSLQ